MERLYTKNGVPLRVRGDRVFGPTGRQVGRVYGEKVFAPSGRYVGTVVNDRLVYRSTDSAAGRGAYAPSTATPSAAAPHVPSAVWGEEPRFG